MYVVIRYKVCVLDLSLKMNHEARRKTNNQQKKDFFCCEFLCVCNAVVEKWMRNSFSFSMYNLIVPKTPTKRKPIPKPTNRREIQFFGVIFYMCSMLSLKRMVKQI